MTKTQTKAAGTNPPPVAKIKVLRVQAAIWQKGTDRTWHEVTLQRGFRRKDGSFGNSQSFDLQSALALQAALAEAIPLLRNLDAAARPAAQAEEVAPDTVDDDGPYISDEVQF